MKKVLRLALASVALLVGTHAATAADTGVTTSTDPAKAAAVERHAQELAARDAQAAAAEPKKAKSSKTATTKSANKKKNAKHNAATTTTSKTAKK
jgi:hypothetical protein